MMKCYSQWFPLTLSLLFLNACSQAPKTPTGELYVLSSPSGAIVEVNNAFFGTTPIEGEPVPSGPCLIKVRKEGYQTETLSLRMVTGQKISREVELEPLTGLVLLRSNPEGASVTMEEVYQGKTPLALHDIELGTHRARLQLLGYENKEIEFTVEDRIPQERLVDLISNSGSLLVESTPSGASLFVDGRNAGITPQNVERIEKGERNIRLEMEGYLPYTRKVLITPKTLARVEAELTPEPASLTIVSNPEDASVYMNGELQGTAPVVLENLSPGMYSVRVSLRGHADEQKTVQLGLGQQVTEEFRLTRNSGTLQLVTRPARVRVNIDGEYMGTTEAASGRTDRVSLPLQIDLLSKGAHTLQLVREGYTFANKRFFIQQDQVTTLEETLDRKFIPNVLVRTGEGEDRTLTGVLIRKHTNGDLELEIRPGVFRTIPAAEVISVEPLKQEEELD